VDQILPLEDKEIARAAAREIAKQHVRIETGAKVESAEASEDGVKVTFNGETEEFDHLCIAAGRGPDVEGLGLDEAGVEREEYGELLGGHIVSVKAADLIQELVNTHELEGGFHEVARTIHPHPAFAEAVMEAARATDGWLIHG